MNSKDHYSKVAEEILKIDARKDQRKSQYFAQNLVNEGKNKLKSGFMAVSRYFGENKKEDKTRTLSIAHQPSQASNVAFQR